MPSKQQKKKIHLLKLPIGQQILRLHAALETGNCSLTDEGLCAAPMWDSDLMKKQSPNCRGPSHTQTLDFRAPRCGKLGFSPSSAGYPHPQRSWASLWASNPCCTEMPGPGLVRLLCLRGSHSMVLPPTPTHVFPPQSCSQPLLECLPNF